jgi:hypothetical protein
MFNFLRNVSLGKHFGGGRTNHNAPTILSYEGCSFIPLHALKLDTQYILPKSSWSKG